MREAELIRGIAGAFPRSPRQRNALFTCDAELLEMGGELWAVTLDEFSPAEDLFTADDPETLGANLATATLGDLYASGAEPCWFVQALCVPPDADARFIDGLAHGIAGVLTAAGCHLCGGDLGTAETWRFSGCALGRVPAERALTRCLPAAPQTLWVTGTLGDANLAALTGWPTPRFELRASEAALIRQYATGCIDTSGGFLEAVWTLHALNPALGFEIALDALPLALALAAQAAALGVPAEAALLGGAGEYELLFTVPASSPGIDAALRAAGITPVGAVRPDVAPGIRFTRNGAPAGAMTAPPPCPRQAGTVTAHMREVVAMARALFG